ncbi:GtrA family protein [Actinomycetospora endophytica]|uniref:GtrA family protein n=1 Tax=Actinomycetospora endophytica TaxID=2291215 RepID=A0ABS8P3W7_9PSEU|nr:GtrA family protein [Actinomycetospora endophytica]MCD2192101.1 GtrA family protein [Actinomycetospora endophytica]
MSTVVRSRERGAWFQRLCHWLFGLLPDRLAAVTPPTLIGFLLISGVSFSLDLALLTVLKSGLQVPLGVAVTLAYAGALTVNFLLNRQLTFRPRRPLGEQVALHVAVVVLNYLAIVLGVTVGFAAWGVPYPVARVVAGVLEVGFVYAAQRWVVFAHRDRGGAATD